MTTDYDKYYRDLSSRALLVERSAEFLDYRDYVYSREIYNQPDSLTRWNFPKFLKDYYHLSELIDKDFDVIDVGSAHALQQVFFTEHKSYLAIDPFTDHEVKIFTYNGSFVNQSFEDYEFTREQYNNAFVIANYSVLYYGDWESRMEKFNRFRRRYVR